MAAGGHQEGNLEKIKLETVTKLREGEDGSWPWMTTYCREYRNSISTEGRRGDPAVGLFVEEDELDFHEDKVISSDKDKIETINQKRTWRARPF